MDRAADTAAITDMDQPPPSTPVPERVHVIGASGRSGATLATALGSRVVPVVRDAAKWNARGSGLSPQVADLRDAEALAEALADATHVVSCAHARHAPAVIAAAPEAATLVFLGSTRKFTRWPDDHGGGVLAGEAAFLASGRCGVMLHPTMIYGATGENNVQRLAALIRRLPVVPLPMGGRALVQPIHQSDVTRALMAALSIAWPGARSLVIAGPDPVSYRDFVLAVAEASGIGRPRLVSIPAAPLIAAATLTRFIPGLPTIGAAEIRRLLEDKAFDIEPMRTILGVTPISLREGLKRTFSP
jgi:nucleoside-diphosphate-sugar epimerase